MKLDLEYQDRDGARLQGTGSSGSRTTHTGTGGYPPGSPSCQWVTRRQVNVDVVESPEGRAELPLLTHSNPKVVVDTASDLNSISRIQVWYLISIKNLDQVRSGQVRSVQIYYSAVILGRNLGP